MTDTKPGGIIHVELSSTDVAATRAFFEAVFGWKFKKEPFPGGEYWSWESGSSPAGGLTSPMGGMPPSTLNYLLVESVDAAVQKITSHGGKIVLAKQEVPQVGWFAIFQSPGGNTMAVFQPKMPR